MQPPLCFGCTRRRGESAAPSALPSRSAPAAARPGAADRRRACAEPRRRPRRAHAGALAQHDLRGARQVLEVLLLHRAREGFVLDHDVQLAVADPARDVQVGRAHARPAAVGDRGLRVHHRPVPLEDAHAGLEQRRGSRRARAACTTRMSLPRPGHEQAHVDAVLRRRAQRLHVGAWCRRSRRRSATACGARAPPRAGRGGSRPVVPGVAGHDAQRDVARRGAERSSRDAARRPGAARRRRAQCRRRRARRRPRRGRASRRRCRATARGRVAGRRPTRWPDAQAGDEGRPRRRPPGTCGGRGSASRAARRAAAGCSSAPRRRRRAAASRSARDGVAERAQPVVDERARARPRAPSRDERLGEALADRVVAQDVGLEVDVAARGARSPRARRGSSPRRRSSRRTALPATSGAPAARENAWSASRRSSEGPGLGDPAHGRRARGLGERLRRPQQVGAEARWSGETDRRSPVTRLLRALRSVRCEDSLARPSRAIAVSSARWLA